MKAISVLFVYMNCFIVWITIACLYLLSQGNKYSILVKLIFYYFFSLPYKELHRVNFTHLRWNSVVSMCWESEHFFYTNTQQYGDVCHHSNVTAMNWQKSELPKSRIIHMSAAKRGKPPFPSTTKEHIMIAVPLYYIPITRHRYSAHPVFFYNLFFQCQHFYNCHFLQYCETISGKTAVTIYNKVNIS